MSVAGVERVFRGIWTFFAVLLVTLAVGFAVGWVVRAAVEKPSEQVTTVEER
jgi:hypothetical protein